MPDAASVGLVVVAILLVVVVAFSAVLPLLARRNASRAARTRMSKAVTDASDEKRPSKERAASLVKAGRTALDGIRRHVGTRTVQDAEPARPPPAAAVDVGPGVEQDIQHLATAHANDRR